MYFEFNKVIHKTHSMANLRAESSYHIDVKNRAAVLAKGTVLLLRFPADNKDLSYKKIVEIQRNYVVAVIVSRRRQ